MNENSLSEALPGRAYRFFSSIESTQDEALAWLRDGAPTGAAIIADEQRAGRGRHGRTWFTPPGVALAVSVILRPPLRAVHQVTMLGALAILESVEHIMRSHALAADDAIQLGIKWPNDVRINGRKISGVLPESVWDGDRLVGVSLGMGLNVRVDFADTALETMAGSVEPMLGIPIGRTQLVVSLLDRVDYWAFRLGTPELFDAWKLRLETLGTHVSIGGIEGIAESVTRDGALVVRDIHGDRHRVIAGDIGER